MHALKKFFTDLLTSWLDDFRLLINLAELKQLILITLNTMWSVIKRPLLWLIPAVVVALIWAVFAMGLLGLWWQLLIAVPLVTLIMVPFQIIVFAMIFGPLFTDLGALDEVVYRLHGVAFIVVAFVLLVILFARPSVGRKDVRYVLASRKTIVAGCLMVLLFVLDRFVFGVGAQSSILLGLPILYLYPGTSCVLSPLLMLIAFFLLDARPAVREYLLSFVRALKMFVYHYPFFAVASAILYLVVAGLMKLIALAAVSDILFMLTLVCLGLVSVMIIIFLVSLVAVSYTRYLRQNFGQYYYE